MIKKILLGVLILLVLAIGGMLTYFYGFLPKSRPAPDVKAPSTPEAVERGRYLAHHVLGCAGCHSDIDEERPGDHIVEGTLLSGRVFRVPEDFPGTLVAPNITPDEETGVGKWTDGELMRAIREGVSRDGRTLFPQMNYGAFKHLPDDDVLSVIAYLRTVKPVKRDVGHSEIKFPVSMFIRAAPKPVEAPPPALPTEPVARGELLLKLMGCADCHTPLERGHAVEGMHMAGGFCFEGAFGKACSSNITSHKAAGIGSMSDDDLMRALREGKGKDGRTLWVMPWALYAGAKEEDLRAVIAALRQVPENAALAPVSEIRAEYKSRK